VNQTLLFADAAINLLLGALLLIYPQWLVEALGLPRTNTAFYPSVLGGVLIGIGIALLLAHRGGAQGLGLDGAIAINLCGAGVLAGWLIISPRMFTIRGRVTLWIVAILVIGIGLVELGHRAAAVRDE
jgi:hypothetical protein